MCGFGRPTSHVVGPAASHLIPAFGAWPTIPVLQGCGPMAAQNWNHFWAATQTIDLSVIAVHLGLDGNVLMSYWPV